MAIENNIITLSHDQSLAEQLEDIATCLGDFRLSTLGRDIGMLCHSPKVNLASLRRPFHVGRFVKAAEVEKVMQEKEYGYAGLRSNSKLTTGNGTTNQFIKHILSKSTDTNLWEPAALDSSDIPGLMQFDGYNHNARFLGVDDTFKCLETIYEVGKGVEFSTATIPADRGGDFYVTTNERIPLTALSSSIKVTFYFTSPQLDDDVVININGAVVPRHNGTVFGGDGETEYFNLNTSGHSVGDTWQANGNTFEYRYDTRLGHCVDMYLSQIFFPRETRLELGALDYWLQGVYNSSRIKGEYAPIIAKITSNGVYNIGPSNATSSNVGFYYEPNNSWLQSDWNTSKQGERTPYQYIFTDNGVTGHSAFFIVVAKSSRTADEYSIVNPRHREGLNDALNGYVIFNNLGFSDNCLNNLTEMYVIKCYGNNNFIDSAYESFTEADSQKFIIAPYGYKKIY